MGLALLHRPLEGSRFDLVEQDIAAPAQLRGGLEVVEAGGGIGRLFQQKHMMSPRDRTDQISHSL